MAATRMSVVLAGSQVADLGAARDILRAKGVSDVTVCARQSEVLSLLQRRKGEDAVTVIIAQQVRYNSLGATGLAELSPRRVWQASGSLQSFELLDHVACRWSACCCWPARVSASKFAAAVAVRSAPTPTVPAAHCLQAASAAVDADAVDALKLLQTVPAAQARVAGGCLCERFHRKEVYLWKFQLLHGLH